VEVVDDILNGIMEDLLESGSFEDSQKEEMRMALEGTVEKSKRKMDPVPAQA